MGANIYFVHDDGSAELRIGDRIVLLDAEDVGIAASYQWSVGKHGYATSGAGEKQVLLHRLKAEAGAEDYVDHINQNKLDNRRGNLRKCSSQQNLMNRPKLACGENEYKGICKTADGSWQAQIAMDGKSIYLGRFNDPVRAAKAYDTAARMFFGEYAYLNFPNSQEEVKVPIKHYRKLSIDEVQSIRYLHGSGVSISELASLYDHSYSSINRIVTGKTFKEVG